MWFYICINEVHYIRQSLTPASAHPWPCM
jgi:hypothetical protein